MKRGSDETIRAFIAIELTEEIHNNLKRLQQQELLEKYDPEAASRKLKGFNA